VITLDINENVIKGVINGYCEYVGAQEPTDAFKEVKRNHFYRCAETLKKNGVKIYTYKSLGVSPRIQPQNYGKTINSFNSIFRTYLFKQIGSYRNKKFGMVLLDLDLVSWYTSILLGLYPDKLPLVKQAVETDGIWEAIRKEFVRQNVGDLYTNSFVKICFYSVLFGGGAKAMINGILEKTAKSLGMTPQQFRDSEHYNRTQLKAIEISSIVNRLPLVKEFRDMSQEIQATHDGEMFVGPSGHSYPINKEEFRRSFCSYLQSCEFTLLAIATNETLEQFEEAELVFHFHDGNVIAVKEEKAKSFLRRVF